MSSPYNAEVEIDAQITRLQLESDDLERRARDAARDADRDILQRRRHELSHEIAILRQRLERGAD